MLKISTRGEYAVRAMLEFGLHEGEELSLREVARRWRVSPEYLEQIVPPLRRAGLVRSKRGARGGYQLARPARDITLAEIVVATEGPFEPVDCLTEPHMCFASGLCAIQEVWGDVRRVVYETLSQVTLADLVDRQRNKVTVYSSDLLVLN